MANSPRVEITDKALKVLKIEAAICGLGQKETLEALILRGASAQSMAIVERKTVIPKVGKIHIMVVENKETIPKKEILPSVETIPPIRDEKMLSFLRQQSTVEALSFILSELEKGNEPTVNEVADKAGLTTTGLGRAMAACGIKAKNTHRDNKTVRIYTKPMKIQIAEILSAKD